MPLKYEHTQKGGFLFYFMLCIFIIMALVWIVVFSFDPDPLFLPFLHFFIMLVYLIELAWFVDISRSLTVKIDDQYIRITFGRWGFRKKLLLTEIESCRIVKNDWWWMRFQGRFDIGAKKAVELIYKNGKKKRIGIDDPEGLAEAIKEAIKTEA